MTEQRVVMVPSVRSLDGKEEPPLVVYCTHPRVSAAMLTESTPLSMHEVEEDAREVIMIPQDAAWDCPARTPWQGECGRCGTTYRWEPKPQQETGEAPG